MVNVAIRWRKSGGDALAAASVAGSETGFVVAGGQGLEATASNSWDRWCSVASQSIKPEREAGDVGNELA